MLQNIFTEPSHIWLHPYIQLPGFISLLQAGLQDMLMQTI